MKALVFRHSPAREAASAIAGGLDLTPVITHRFPVERWDEAVLALKDSRRTGAVKVLLEPAP